MRLLFLFAFLVGTTAVVLPACLVNSSCACPVIAPTVTFVITDAVDGNSIQDPVFTLDGASVNGQCIGVFQADAAPDAGPFCEQWQLSLPVGHSTVSVGAVGYQTQTFELDATMSGGCCSSGSQLHETVALSH